MRGSGQNVRNGLRFSGARRALHNEIGPSTNLLYHLGLGGIRVDDLDDVGWIENFVQLQTKPNESGS